MIPVRAWCVKGPDGNLPPGETGLGKASAIYEFCYAKSSRNRCERGDCMELWPQFQQEGYICVPVTIYEDGEALVVAWKLGNHIYADVPNFQRDYPSSTPLFDRPDGAEATALLAKLWALTYRHVADPFAQEITDFLKDRKHG